MPVGMQQFGSFGSYPVGHSIGHTSLGQPPKHRGMPALSSLQTSFLPSQQFCDALMLPPPGSTGAPQMLPTGLQACPLSQRPGSSGSHATSMSVPGPPPQHASLTMQNSPVSVHPPAI